MQFENRKKKGEFCLVNAITICRLVAFPVLILLIITHNINVFKWLLGFCFFTDFIDGSLARQFHVESILGARLDSIGDDLTIIAAITGVIVLKTNFVKSQFIVIAILLALFIVQTILALLKYKKITSFHTYAAKCAAILQGVFLILLFFLPEPSYFLFYAASVITAIDLVEEIILVIILREWKVNVKGLYWVLKKQGLHS